MRFTRQAGLVRETARMAFETLRANKMRSALTVLGVVIGVTSIVGMTSLIRGFDTSLRDSIAALGPKTIFVAALRRGQLFVGRVVPRPGPSSGPHRRRRRGDSRGWRRRSRSSIPGWAPVRPADHGADVLPGRANSSLCDHGHQRAVRRRQLREVAGRPRLHRAGGGAAEAACGDRVRAIRGAVRARGASIRLASTSGSGRWTTRWSA